MVFSRRWAAIILLTALAVTPLIRPTFERFADLKPNVLLPMHGSVIVNDCEKILRDNIDLVEEYSRKKYNL